MSTRPEALRLADELDQYLYSVPAHPLCTDAAAELRRLHAENERLAAALASSCDEQRHELWESGGVAGCERARVAERQRDTLLVALKPMIELAEFWINHRQERHMSEEQYKVWIALGHESNAMLKARVAIKAVEETK